MMDASYENDDYYDLEFSEDSDTEPNVDLENQYYNSKSLKKNKPMAALKSFQDVLNLEGENKGDWGFKALKQMIKINFDLENFEEMTTRYKELLTYVKSAVTRNYSEKSINSILNYISTSSILDVLQTCYEITLEALKTDKNYRLWFNTNTKLALLYYKKKNYFQLKKIIKSLREFCQIANDLDDHAKGTQLLEIYALEIQMYTDQKQNKKLKAIYEESLRIRSALPHPNIMGIIRECGGKMHLRDGKFYNAHTDFFEAFRNYEDCGSSKAPTCLKYVVLTNMLMKSNINPFDSPEAKPYKNFPEILVMTQLLDAYQAQDTKRFELIIKQNKAKIMNDPFLQEHIEDLYRNVRIQYLTNIIKPYNRIGIPYIATELILEVDEVESLLVTCILDGLICGRIDQKNEVLLLDRKKLDSSRYNALNTWVDRTQSLLLSAVSRFN